MKTTPIFSPAGVENPYGPFFPWKTLLYPEKCRAILRGEFPPPVTIHVYPSNLCQNNCPFCIMRGERKANPAQLSEAIAAEIVEYANRAGVGAVHVSGGGEPLLWPGDLGIFRQFRGPLILSTNGRGLTPEKAAPFNRIRVSVNAGTAETYTAAAGVLPGAWLDLLDRLAAVRAARPSGQKIGLGFVAAPENWTDIPAAVAVADQLGLDFVHIRPAYYPRESPENAEMLRLAGAIYHCCQACSEARPRVAVYGTAEKFAGYWSPRLFDKCRATPLHAVISATGEFLVCQDVFIRFGDLNRARFADIWGGAEHLAALNKIDLGDCPRCVMGRPNEIIERVFMRDEIMGGLL